MGGEYQCESLPDMSAEELQAKYRDMVNECLYNDGHGGYSGTFAEKPDLDVLSDTFDTEDDAREFCIDNDKWGPSWAVRVEQPEPHWYIGGWCSS